MSEAKETGGPAFPIPGYDGDTSMSDPVEGMTLRDFFAAKAMVYHFGRFSMRHERADAETNKECAIRSYCDADAMIQARSAK